MLIKWRKIYIRSEVMIFLAVCIVNMIVFTVNSQQLLFRPKDGMEFQERTWVSLLEAKYNVYKTALKLLIDDWLEGHVGEGQPTELWERIYIERVNREVNDGKKHDTESTKETDENIPTLEELKGKKAINMKHSSSTESVDVDTGQVYNRLVAINVPGHLKIVTSHRRWIRLTYDFLKLISADFSVGMSNLIRRHDLSKYTHREVLGYAIKFGDGTDGNRKLNTEKEIFEWNNTLYNHYIRNPHHPEYFYPLQDDGTRDRSISVIDTLNGKEFLDESLIDMLASRGERDLAADKKLNVKKWFNMDEKYFRRYNLYDKHYVLRRLENFYDLAQKFFSQKENMKLVTGFFNSRRVVFE